MSSSGNLDAGAKIVLIIEDNPLNMKLFKEVLELHGYDAVAAEDGSSGLALARERRPDVVLLDIQLPMMSGFEVLRHLKQDPDLQSVPVIAVTAHAMAGDESTILGAGCEEYLTKPVSIERLIEVVGHYASVGAVASEA
jgi:two-component system cell cycle response regulator DivK